MLQGTTIHLPAGLGINEGVRAEHVEPGSANLAQVNVRQTAKGALYKRFGFSAQTLNRLDGTTRSQGNRLVADGTRVAVIDGSKLDTYSPEVDVNSTQDRMPECATREIFVPQHSLSGITMDVEYANGLFCVATSGNGLYASLVDATTGAIVRGPDQVSSSHSWSQIVSFGDRYFVAFVAVVGTTTITAYIIDTNTASSINTGWSTLATVTSALSGLLVSACSLTDRVAVVWATASGTNRANVATYNASGVVETATINTSSTTPSVVVVDGSIADTLWVAWNEGTACKLVGLDADSLASTLATAATVITATTGVRIITLAPGTTGAGRYVVSDSATAVQSHVRSWTTSAGAVSASGSQVTIYNASPSSRLFYQGGRFYSTVMTGNSAGTLLGNTQANCILVDWSEDVTYLRPVANIAPGLVSIPNITSKSVTGPTSGKRYFATSISRGTAAAGAGLNNEQISTSALVEFDFTSRARWLSVDHSGSTYMGGGTLVYFDGTRVQEAGFLVRPTAPTTSVAGSGLSLTNGRQYVCIYEDVDANGNWIVSGISDPSASTGPVVDDTVTVTTRPLTVSYRAAGPGARVAFYATLDSNSNEPPYYRLGATVNSTGSATVTFADTVSDATLAASAKLYSPNLPSAVGASLDRRAPPGLLHLVSYNGMLVGSRGPDLWWSGQPVRGEATWFSPIFQVPVEGGGDITGLAVLDGSVVIFKRREIHMVSGEPPADNATTGGLGLPRRLSVDVGCIEPNSIVVTALGIFFQSERGIELLTRAQSVEWIGEPVQETVTSFPVCTAATLNPYDSIVYFEMATGESAGLVTGTGRTLVYDLTLRAWVSTDRRKNQAGTADTPAQSAAMVWTGSAWRYAWLGTDGRVYVENRSSYLDPGSVWVTAQYETPWVKLGLQQEHLAWTALLLAEQGSASGITVEIAYDFAAYSGANDKVYAEAAALSKRQFELRTKTHGHSVKFRVKDTAPVTLGTGEGFAFVGMSVDIAPKKGSTKGTPRLDPEMRR